MLSIFFIDGLNDYKKKTTTKYIPYKCKNFCGNLILRIECLDI